MKRFKWPLQCLLDVTIQREKVLQSELMRLAPAMARVRQDLIRRRAIIRQQLEDLADANLPDRIARQEVFMKFSRSTQKQIERIEKQLSDLKRRRREMMAKLVEVRNSRDVLERQREEDRRQHLRAEVRLEQKAFDESAQVSFVRQRAQGEVAARP